MISIKHNFVFVHPPKTGGNTIHNILKDYYDPVISTNIKRNGIGPRDGVDFATKKKCDRNPGVPTRRHIPNKHWPYHQVINSYGDVPFEESHPDPEFEYLEELRLISTIRNPYERIVSFFSFRTKGVPTTVAQLKRWYNKNKIPTCVSHWSGYEPDFVVRMEHFEADVTQLLYYLDIPNNLSEVGKVNASKWRKAGNAYQRFYKDSNGDYDEEFIAKIRQEHSEDFEFSKRLFCKPYEF